MKISINVLLFVIFTLFIFLSYKIIKIKAVHVSCVSLLFSLRSRTSNAKEFCRSSCLLVLKFIKKNRENPSRCSFQLFLIYL